jgi:hypothetical protein
MQLVVKTLSNKVVRIQAEPTDSVESLWEQFLNVSCIPASQRQPMQSYLAFTLGEQQLSEKSCLSHYDIQHETTLRLNLRRTVL